MAEAFHRKIELQSPDDLTYLIANIRRAAEGEIEKALPRIHGQAEAGEGDMRVVVEKLVGEYIQQTLQTILPNITINGLPPSPSLIENTKSGVEEAVRESVVFEPFNAKAWAKATELMAKEDDLIEEIAKLRREVPGRVVERDKVGYREGIEGDEGFVGVVDARVGEGERGGVVLSGEGEERREVVKGTWVRGVEGLERVVEGGPGVVAKVEKAGRAEEYVRGMGR